MRAGTAAILCAAIALLGCRPDPATPRGTAERFLDAHYVRIDLPASHTLTTGLARHKVEREMELVAGQVIDESTRKPTVHYRLLEERPAGNGAVNFVYLARITVEDADRFERRLLVTVRAGAEGWRVSNYDELRD
jgi:hypothetical protein